MGVQHKMRSEREREQENSFNIFLFIQVLAMVRMFMKLIMFIASLQCCKVR